MVFGCILSPISFPLALLEGQLRSGKNLVPVAQMVLLLAEERILVAGCVEKDRFHWQFSLRIVEGVAFLLLLWFWYLQVGVEFGLIQWVWLRFGLRVLKLFSLKEVVHAIGVVFQRLGDWTENQILLFWLHLEAIVEGILAGWILKIQMLFGKVNSEF